MLSDHRVDRMIHGGGQRGHTGHQLDSEHHRKEGACLRGAPGPGERRRSTAGTSAAQDPHAAGVQDPIESQRSDGEAWAFAHTCGIDELVLPYHGLSLGREGRGALILTLTRTNLGTV